MIVIPFMALALSQAPNFTNAPSLDIGTALSGTNGPILQQVQAEPRRPMMEQAEDDLIMLLDFLETDRLDYTVYRGVVIFK